MLMRYMPSCITLSEEVDLKRLDPHMEERISGRRGAPME
jgi:hypothetical protein